MNQYVRTLCSSEWIPIQEVAIEFVDVSENVYGEDVITYKCSMCGEIHSSIVISRGYED